MLRHLLYPFLPYRSLAFPILVLSLIVFPCWLVFRVYRIRTSRRPWSASREILLLIFVLYLSGLAAVTLVPSHPSQRVADTSAGIQLRPNLGALTCSPTILPGGSAERGFCMRNARGNLLLLFPFGILLPLVWRAVRLWRGILIAIALSLSIEILQYLSRSFGSYRTADINDLILNVLGASLGFVLMSLLRLRHAVRS